MGLDYAVLALESRADGIYLVQAACAKADKGGVEKENTAIKLDSDELYLRVKVKQTTRKPTQKPDYKCECTFYYSLDGKKYEPIGKTFTAKEGKWIGAKVGLFCTRPWKSNDSGWLESDWFRITK